MPLTCPGVDLTGMADALMDSDCEEDMNLATGKLAANASFEESDDDSMAGFEDDLDPEEGDDGSKASNEAVKRNGAVSTKRKRKRADPSKRKHIRRILREDELTDITISAQKEERERLRRLELQRSLAAASAVSATVQGSKSVENSNTSSCARQLSPVSVDIRQKRDNDCHIIVIDDSDDEGELSSSLSSSTNCSHSQSNTNGDLIEIISSDSELENDESDYDDDDDDDECSNSLPSDFDYDNSGLHVDDTLNQVDSQGRVLVNVNHPPDEEDIFLATQVAKVIKPHQVGFCDFVNMFNSQNV